MEQSDNSRSNDILFRSSTCTALAVASGLSFFFVCMILPLVGPAGSKVDHALKNKAAFLAVLMLTLLLSGLSTYANMGRRKSEGGSLPWTSLALCGVCLVTLIILLFDGFSI